MKAFSSRRAFTLVELLVVIGVIAVLVGGLGLSLRGGNGAASLQAAQSSLSSLVGAARAQAAVSQAPATVVIWANPTDSDTYLQRAAVMLDLGGGKWTIKGDMVDLPTGVFFVPPDLGATLPAMYEAGKAADWPDSGTYRTQATGGAPEDMTIQIWDPTTSAYVNDTSYPSTFKAYQTVGISSIGLKSNANECLVVATGETVIGANAATSGVIFKNAESQRGLFLSAYGIPTIINERAGLDK